MLPVFGGGASGGPTDCTVASGETAEAAYPAPVASAPPTACAKRLHPTATIAAMLMYFIYRKNFFILNTSSQWTKKKDGER
jgi:hypothetical protein